MKKEINLEPVTRIEGNIKVRIELDEVGDVVDAHAHLTEFRGFETFLIGRHITRVPFIVPRICGVCPTPHHLASAKAIDAGLQVETTETAKMLRELMLTGGFIHDHTLHLFVLAGPDILLADMPPERRGFVELNNRFPEVVKEVVGVRAVGQRIVATLGVQATHPCTAVPGGISKNLSKKDRDNLLNQVKETKEKVIGWYDKVIPVFEKFADGYKGLGGLETNFVGLVNDDNLDLYNGRPRIVDKKGAATEFEPSDYLKYVAERTVEYSYAKRCYIKSAGLQDGMYRVGPLARVNVAENSLGEHSAKLLKEFKSKYGAPAQETLAYHFARYICLVYAVERAEQLLEDDKIVSMNIRSPVNIKSGEGVGIVEAPRGMLIHHYRWDSNGYITMANLIVPTTQNSYPIDASMKKVVERSIRKGKVDETKLWHETGAVIRAYDPCISCATHTITIIREGKHRQLLK